MNRVDTEKAYQILWEQITSLELNPGDPLDITSLAKELELSQTAVRDALQLLVHEHLVEAPPRGLNVARLSFADLEKVSTIRLSLETLSAQQAARNATADDLVILNALCEEVASDTREHFKLDQRFHQAIAQAAHNPYLAETLKRLYGLSKRLWFLALPYLDFLPSAVKSHVKLVEAIRDGDEDQAMKIMKDHIEDFYHKIREIITEKGLIQD
jgi:DNA-binding GntR family transcriptional regulator